jgi:hypothetical protein
MCKEYAYPLASYETHEPTMPNPIIGPFGVVPMPSGSAQILWYNWKISIRPLAVFPS